MSDERKRTPRHVRRKAAMTRLHAELRIARRERDEAQAVLRTATKNAKEWWGRAREAEAERDEARLDGEQMRARNGEVMKLLRGVEQERDEYRDERDAARAQVAALQDAIGTDDEVEAYLNNLPWTADATDHERTLVAGNIRTFHGWIKDRAGGDE